MNWEMVVDETAVDKMVIGPIVLESILPGGCSDSFQNIFSSLPTNLSVAPSWWPASAPPSAKASTSPSSPTTLQTGSDARPRTWPRPSAVWPRSSFRTRRSCWPASTASRAASASPFCRSSTSCSRATRQRSPPTTPSSGRFRNASRRTPWLPQGTSPSTRSSCSARLQRPAKPSTSVWRHQSFGPTNSSRRSFREWRC